jgi:hypothetical protein
MVPCGHEPAAHKGGRVAGPGVQAQQIERDFAEEGTIAPENLTFKCVGPAAFEGFSLPLYKPGNRP